MEDAIKYIPLIISVFAIAASIGFYVKIIPMIQTRQEDQEKRIQTLEKLNAAREESDKYVKETINDVKKDIRDMSNKIDKLLTLNKRS